MDSVNDSEGHKEVVLPEGIIALHGPLGPSYEHTAFFATEEPRQYALRRKFAWCSLVLGLIVGLFVGGGAVGGGLGVELASCQQDKHILRPSNSSNSQIGTAPIPGEQAAVDLRNFTVPAPDTVVSLFLNCPEGQQSFELKTYKFVTACNVDLIGNMGANGRITDLLALVMYTWQDCVAACVDFNERSSGNQCRGVTFLASMQKRFQTNPSNCILKSDTLARGRTGAPLDNAISVYIDLG